MSEMTPADHAAAIRTALVEPKQEACRVCLGIFGCATWCPAPRALKRLAALVAQAETAREALRQARVLAIAVADKDIGELSEQARRVQGLANTVLDDLPSVDDIAGLLAGGDSR